MLSVTNTPFMLKVVMQNVVAHFKPTNEFNKLKHLSPEVFVAKLIVTL
jgi:hypothetical protein